MNLALWNKQQRCVRQRRFNILTTVVITTLLLVNMLYSFPVDSKTVKNDHPLTGIWIESKKQKIAVWVEECQTKLCGRIYWLKKPLTKDGKIKRDVKNPNAALRTRLQCGMKILTDFSASENSNFWKNGKIYNPKSGKTYQSTIHVSKDGTLEIRGYIGISLFGKTLKWERPKDKLTPCDQSAFTQLKG